MKQFLSIFVLSFFCLQAFAQDPPPTYFCQIDNNNVCRFTGVERTADDPYWTPAAAAPSSVLKVAFDSSTMPLFTDDVCKAFPNLQELVVRSSQVEWFVESAFHNCRKLKVLDFYTNQIQEVHESAFTFSEALEIVRLDSNAIQDLPTNLLVNLVNLTQLYVGDNQLEFFPSFLLQRNNKLEFLQIHSNDLLDLDYKKIIEYVPSLNTIEYNANQFSCAHVSEMNAAFTDAGVRIGTASVARTRFYPQQREGNVLCSPDISWSGAYYRNAFNTLDDSDNLLYTKKEVKDFINDAIEESNAALKEEIKNLRLLIKAISAKIQGK